MRKLLIANCAMYALIGPGMAADLQVKAPIYKAPAAAAAFNWTGCYIGGFAGGDGGGRTVFTDLGNADFASYSGGVTAARIVPSHSWNDDLGGGFTGGATVGCNWQPIGSPLVLGLEGESGYMHLNGQAYDPRTVVSTQTTPDVQGSARVGDWYGMITGRLGYAWGSTLLYVKGGAAFIPVRASVLDQCLSVALGCGNWIISTSGSELASTWTVGGGVEWALAAGWSVKAEYMFIGMGDTLTTCGNSMNPAGATTPGGPFCFNHRFDGIQAAKIGLNYRFGAI
jgi:outer membrane immunogenic protein